MKADYRKFALITIIIFTVASRYAAALEQMELIEQTEKLGSTEQPVRKILDKYTIGDAGGGKIHFRLVLFINLLN